MLEPDASKGARPVLRGGGGGDPIPLLDYGKAHSTTDEDPRSAARHGFRSAFTKFLVDLFDDPVVLLGPIRREGPGASPQAFTPRLWARKDLDGDLDLLPVRNPRVFHQLNGSAVDHATKRSGHEGISVMQGYRAD
jgi:hypothetical protein